MNKNYEQEIQAMQRLINYGQKENVNENRGTGSVVEYHAEAADGKTYGIVRECNKFYIKVAPKKDTPLVTEDYEYIGGFNNKKFNEYPTYTIASKQFDLKLKSINEAYAANNKVSSSQFKQPESAEWQINETKEMRRDIDRFNQLVGNVDDIMKQGYLTEEFTSKHDIPEAPGRANVTDKSVSTPFEVPATASGHKEVNSKQVNHEKAGGPYDNTAKVEMQSDKKPKSPGNSGDPFDKGPKYGPKFDKKDVVADDKPSGGEVVKLKEGINRTVKLTEEQVLAWNRKNKDYMDKSHGTEIGHNGDPFEDEVHLDNDRNINTEYRMNEGAAVHITDNQNIPTPGTGDAKSKTSPFDDDVEIVYEMEINDDDQQILADGEGDEPIDDDEDLPDVIDVDVDRIGFDDEPEEIDDANAYNGDNSEISRLMTDPVNTAEKLDIYTLLDDDDDFGGDDFGDFYESRRRRGRRMNEGTVLDDFGKHPAYQKQVMTLPPNKEIDRWGRDWNDKSAKGDAPYGIKVGSGAPFTEEVIDMLTDAVISRLNAHKKKD